MLFLETGKSRVIFLRRKNAANFFTSQNLIFVTQITLERIICRRKPQKFISLPQNGFDFCFNENFLILNFYEENFDANENDAILSCMFSV